MSAVKTSLFLGLGLLVLGLSVAKIYSRGEKTAAIESEKNKNEIVHSASLKYKTFLERAEKAKQRGDEEQAKQQYLQAVKTLEIDFKKTQSTWIAEVLYYLHREPKFGIKDKSKQLYYMKYLDEVAFDKYKRQNLYDFIEDGGKLDEATVNELCNIYQSSVSNNDYELIIDLINLERVAHENNIILQTCAGQTIEQLEARIFDFFTRRETELEAYDFELILRFLVFNKNQKNEYSEHLISLLLGQPKYSRGLADKIGRYIRSQGTREQKKQLINVWENIEKQNSRSLHRRAEFYRSRFMDVADLEKSRKTYEQAVQSGSVDSFMPLFYMQYLGLGGPVDKNTAHILLDAGVEGDREKSHLIDLCFVMSGVREKTFSQSIETRLKDFLWTGDGRALNAFSVYWQLRQDISAAEAFVLMEGAAIEGSDWGREGMAQFYEAGYGVNKNIDLAKIWRNKIGQGGEDVPILSIPAADCKPSNLSGR